MNDAVIYWIETSEPEIHFIDAIVSAYDGLASVRRDFRLRDGHVEYKVYVSPGMEAEFLDVMERLRTKAEIRGLIREDEDASSAATG